MFSRNGQVSYDDRDVEFQQIYKGVKITKLKSGQVICCDADPPGAESLAEAVILQNFGEQMRANPLFNMQKSLGLKAQH
jgi:hypothetical protein